MFGLDQGFVLLEVKWKDCMSTFEPESSLKEDDPHTLASYIQRSGLSSRSKRCQWASGAIYNAESTGGGSGGDSVNLSSDEEAGDTTKREAPGSDPGEHSDAKFFAVRSFGASCTLSSGAIFLSHQDAVENAAANHMEQPGNNMKGFDNIDDALSFASSLVEKKEPCSVTNIRSSKVDDCGLLFAPEAPLQSPAFIVTHHSAKAPPTRRSAAAEGQEENNVTDGAMTQCADYNHADFQQHREVRHQALSRSRQERLKKRKAKAALDTASKCAVIHSLTDHEKKISALAASLGTDSVVQSLESSPDENDTLFKCPVCYEHFDACLSNFSQRQDSHLPVRSAPCAHRICCSCLVAL
jgi:hypothetical protein